MGRLFQSMGDGRRIEGLRDERVEADSLKCHMRTGTKPNVLCHRHLSRRIELLKRRFIT